MKAKAKKHPRPRPLPIEHRFHIRFNKAFPVIRPRGRLEIFGVMAGLVRRTR